MMLPFLAQAGPDTFWNAPTGSGELWTYLVVTLIIGFAIMFGLMYVPNRARRPIVMAVTFIAGAFWVVYWAWPKPYERQPGDIPQGLVERGAFWLEDGIGVISPIAQVLGGLLLGLGVYSVLRYHLGKLFKGQKDWQFSLTLLISMVLMVVFGYWNWNNELDNPALLESKAQWGFAQYMFDLLFDGLLQQMDAAMFSMIAFFILSAAYRAFRIRSVESTILLASALILILSLMGLAESASSMLIDSVTGNDPNHILNSLKLSVMSDWIRTTVQTPGIRALEFGISIGALAMGLRLWLSLERGGLQG